MVFWAIDLRRQVHKHSGMGCAVVSLSAAETREAIMCYAEKTFGRSAQGKLEMDIADVKVQLPLGKLVIKMISPVF